MCPHNDMKKVDEYDGAELWVCDCGYAEVMYDGATMPLEKIIGVMLNPCLRPDQE